MFQNQYTVIHIVYRDVITYSHIAPLANSTAVYLLLGLLKIISGYLTHIKHSHILLKPFLIYEINMQISLSTLEIHLQQHNYGKKTLMADCNLG